MVEEVMKTVEPQHWCNLVKRVCCTDLYFLFLHQIFMEHFFLSRLFSLALHTDIMFFHSVISSAHQSSEARNNCLLKPQQLFHFAFLRIHLAVRTPYNSTVSQQRREFESHNLYTLSFSCSKILNIKYNNQQGEPYIWKKQISMV